MILACFISRLTYLNLLSFIPNLHVEIEFEDKRVDLVAEGYDLALRIGYMQDSSLVARKISSSPMHFVASPSYLEVTRHTTYT